MPRVPLPLILALSLSCSHPPQAQVPARQPAPRPAPAPAPVETGPTATEVHEFVAKLDEQLRARVVAASLAEWDKNTNITDATELAAAKANEALMAFTSEAIRQSVRFTGIKDVPAEDARALELLRRSASLPAPDNEQARAELAGIAAKMEGLYGKGKACKGSSCRDLAALEAVLAKSRKEPELREAWEGWHEVGQGIRPLFARYVELANEGARTIGFKDLGEVWRSRYDMPPEAFTAESSRLWEQVRPLYEQLHCHVRAKLAERYGKSLVPEQGPIPVHLLGNMWGQVWQNLYPLLEPYKGQPSLDVTPAMKAQKYDGIRMVKLGEAFFTSLGLPPLPDTFWQRSMFEKPKGREVVCHASAWDVTYRNDLRIKMCIKTDMEDLVTIHHELGHNYYFSQYYTLPMLFQEGAHDGFHEAIGDAIARSITPAYLKQVGLLSQVSDNEKATINKLMQDALGKVAFLPFGKLIDEWRWKVFSGEIKPDRYNAAWWEMRERTQGIAPPGPRGEDFFDPGAKYHIPANVPYTRYFLAAVLQYQFHRALCKVAGHKGPLHTCSIYGSRAAGAKLKAMLAMGAKQPWPDALEALTGERSMDASAIVDYYAPLMAWLAEQNKARRCGWSPTTAQAGLAAPTQP